MQGLLWKAVHTEAVHTEAVHIEAVHTEAVHIEAVHTEAVHSRHPQGVLHLPLGMEPVPHGREGPAVHTAHWDSAAAAAVAAG
jgi:hypothetical protein